MRAIAAIVLGICMSLCGVQVENMEKIDETQPVIEVAQQIHVDEEKPATEESKPSDDKAESGTITASITHYCACNKCNGKWSYTEDGINKTKTAMGVILHDGISGNYCAATFGSLGNIVVINGAEYTIVDRMGSNSGYKIDIFVGEGHARCIELGRYKAEVELRRH